MKIAKVASEGELKRRLDALEDLLPGEVLSPSNGEVELAPTLKRLVDLLDSTIPTSQPSRGSG